MILLKLAAMGSQLHSISLTDRHPTNASRGAIIKIDWDAVERDYRSGSCSLRELRRRYGPSPQAVLRRVNKFGWSRDLALPIQLATQKAVLQAVSDEKRRRQDISTQLQRQGVLQNDAEQVAGAAEDGAAVLLQHRREVGQARHLAMAMLTELRLASQLSGYVVGLVGLVTDSGNVATGELDAYGIKQALASLTSLGERAKTLDRLTSSLVKVQGMERKAYNLDVVNNEGERSGRARQMTDVERAHRFRWLMEKVAGRLGSPSADCSDNR